MFSIGSHKARYSFITKVVYLPPVKLGVVLLTQDEKGAAEFRSALVFISQPFLRLQAQHHA